MKPTERAIITWRSIDQSRSAISTEPERFRRQIEAIAASGLPVVELSELGASPAGIALTFDDGFKNFVEYALPLLRRFRMPATLFVVSDFVGRVNRWAAQPASAPKLPLLDWPEIRELHRQGISIGCHSATHTDLTTLGTPELLHEIVDSKKRIEDETGDEVQAFAYPCGLHDARVRRITSAHYKLAVDARASFLTGKEEAHQLPRVDARYFRADFWWDKLLSDTARDYIRLRRIIGRVLSPSISS